MCVSPTPQHVPGKNQASLRGSALTWGICGSGVGYVRGHSLLRFRPLLRSITGCAVTKVDVLASEVYLLKCMCVPQWIIPS